MNQSIALAACEFIGGPLSDNPHRVGKQFRPPQADKHSARRGNHGCWLARTRIRSQLVMSLRANLVQASVKNTAL